FGARAKTTTLAQELLRTSVDAYTDEPGRQPSAPMTFYALVPARGHLTLVPADGEIDVSLAELDPEATRTLPTAGSEPAAHERMFVSRRPTNFASFAPDAHGTLRLGPAGDVPLPSADLRLLRVLRPAGAELHRDGRTFSNVTSFALDLPDGEARG